jgi:thiol-disulfide isomerase/thioredoxin
MAVFMKMFPLLFTVILALNLAANAQTNSGKPKRHLTESTIVKDSSGMVYPYVVWKKLVSSGDYRVKAIDPGNDSTGYLIIKLDSAQKDKRMSRLPKPKESIFFTDGEKIASFTARDINGNKIKLKDLEGKVVVLNFWFIGCPPCRKEIPELNEIALNYAGDANVVFIAVALDGKDDIEQFIKTNPFGYHIIDDGRSYANIYGIHLYPTNVILDKEGKVRFHASGYTVNTPYWIKKTIDELK